MDSSPIAIVYRDQLLMLSETFIINQVSFYSRYIPKLVGARRVNEHNLDDFDMFLVRHGPFGLLYETSYKLLAFAPHLSRYMKKTSPAVVHAHFGKDATFLVPLIERLQLPFMVTYHGTDSYTSDEWKRRQRNLSNRVYLRRRNRLIETADLFIAVSQHVKAGLIRQGIPESKIIVHYIGINVDHFTPVWDKPKDPVVLFVSRLFDYKGCDYLIEAMCRVCRHVQGARLVIIGDGPCRSELKQLAAHRRLPCEFLGAQSHKVVRQWMEKAAVFSVPSFWEGLPTAVQEAMAMGLPMALFDIPPVREAVGNALLAECLAPPKDVRRLSEIIIQFLNNKERSAKFSREARRRVTEFFDIRKQTHRLESIYDEVSGASKKGKNH
ncbi:MAG: glycosyltransferase [Chitinivibrionales bacterium]|nr:glycosyltransferase [Chitinivibrionales bacterium]MBD3356141.1 glycosyltransferase [Chitinivibrionales bacterium]